MTIDKNFDIISRVIKMFLVSTKGRYALRVMLDLAEQNSEKFIPLKEIAERQGISKKYLEAVLKFLVEKNFLRGVHGRGGGYKLTRQPSEYTVGEILELTETALSVVECLKGENTCERKAQCLTLPMWQKYNQLTHDFFYGITLQDILDKKIKPKE